MELPPPTLKTLYRRAAMRLHPDLAPTDAERAAREQQMMEVNEAYAAEHRPRLEALLLAAGESPERVLGGTAPALKHWLSQCEQIVQARTRVVQAQLAWLRTQALTRMCEAVERAELTGLRPSTSYRPAAHPDHGAPPGALHRPTPAGRRPAGGRLPADAVFEDDGVWVEVKRHPPQGS